MNNFKKTALIAIASTGLSMNAHATDTDRFIGVKFGQVSINADQEVDNTELSYGASVGRYIKYGLGAEAEWVLSSSIQKETIDLDTVKNVDLETYYSTIGLYGIYKKPLPISDIKGLYVKGKAGYAKSSIRFKASKANYETYDEDLFSDSGFAYGIGAGYDISEKNSVEVEYDVLPSIENVNHNNIALTLNRKF